MLTKLIFLSALLFGIGAAVRPPIPNALRTSLKISKLSGEPLIESACKGIGDNETECVSILQSATSDQKADANKLLLFTLGYVENRAEMVVEGIKNLSRVADAPPLLQLALTDCHEQYTSIDDLIETASDAVRGSNYAEAQRFIVAAIASIDVCNSQLNTSSDGEKAENQQGENVGMEKDLKKYNLLHRNLLCAALNVLTID